MNPSPTELAQTLVRRTLHWKKTEVLRMAHPTEKGAILVSLYDKNCALSWNDQRIIEQNCREPQEEIAIFWRRIKTIVEQMDLKKKIVIAFIFQSSHLPEIDGKGTIVVLDRPKPKKRFTGFSRDIPKAA